MGGVRDEREDVQALFAAGEGAAQAFNEKGRELYEFARMVACHAHCAFRRCLEGKQSVRWWHAALALFVVFSVFPSVSYAANEQFATVDGPFVTGKTTNNDGYVVLNAGNKYISALAVIGRASDYLQLSNDQLAKLSNSSTGGKFYELASEFVALGNDGSDNHYVGWWGDVLYQSNEVYINGGYGHVWAVETNRSKIASALEDYLVIYNGGDLGGSLGGDSQSGTLTKTITMNRIFGQAGLPTITIDDGLYNALVGIYSEGYFFAYYSTVSYAYVVGVSNYKLDFVEETLYGRLYASLKATQRTSYVLYASSSNSMTLGNSSRSSSTIGSGSTIFLVRNDNSLLFTDFTASEPVTPPTNWPDTPTVGTPEPPEVPEPVNDTPTPQPTGPTFEVNPTFPTYVDISTTNYTVDIQGILDAMDDHCIHLQDALHWNFDHFWTVLSTKWTNDLSTFKTFLYGQFGWIGDTIVDQMEQTRDYLKELFEWLADQFDFSFSGDTYNDKNVVSWLRKIYSKLGTGGNTKPVDPVSNPTETGSWLDNLINNLLVALGSLFPSLIGGVTDFFSGVVDSAGDLTKKFPVSLPWDIAALLALLVAEPVAPVLDIPCYTLGANGLSQVGTYHITLADYGTAWEGVRVAMLISFAVYLAAHTKDFLDVIEGVLL